MRQDSATSSVSSQPATGGPQRTLPLIACLLLAVSCDSDSVQHTAAPAQLSAETFENFGNYELHFNALGTDLLTPEVARAYGIQRDANRVLLNVVLLHRNADGEPRLPVAARVSVDAYTLTGQVKSLQMRRVSEGTAISYIGEVSISDTEVLVFDIKAVPEGGTETFAAKFRREFFAG